VSECLGIERRFSGVFELHSSGLALTVVSGKVVLLDLDKGKSFGFDAMTLEFNKVCPYALNAPPFPPHPRPIKLSSVLRISSIPFPANLGSHGVLNTISRASYLQRRTHSIRYEALEASRPPHLPS
jgi:hypothetical protein